MRPTIGRFALTFCGLLVPAWASGCADINVHNSEPAQSTAYQAAPVDDGRAAGRIRDENASLRTTMESLEQKHALLASAVEVQEQRKDDLKHQRKMVEKDRDRCKKRLENDD